MDLKRHWRRHWRRGRGSENQTTTATDSSSRKQNRSRMGTDSWSQRQSRTPSRLTKERGFGNR